MNEIILLLFGPCSTTSLEMINTNLLITQHREFELRGFVCRFFFFILGTI